MKNKMMMLMASAAGVGIYMGLSKISKNRNKIKRKVNTLIDDTADIFE